MKDRHITVPVTCHVALQDVEVIEAAARRQGMARATYIKALLRAEVARVTGEASAAEKEVPA